MSRPLLDERSWQEFQRSGLLWFVNRTLHLFGWALVFEMDGDTVVRVYPARTRFRGFEQSMEEQGFKMLTETIAATADELLEDVQGEAG